MLYVSKVQLNGIPQIFMRRRFFCLPRAMERFQVHNIELLLLVSRLFKGLFTRSGGPRSSGVGFFCFHALGDTKQKKPTPLDRGPPLHVNRV